jgi:hypothetical protein
VRLVLKDVKKQSGQGFEPVVSSLRNYFPFGMKQYERSAESGGTRFGYNAMLKDDDLKAGETAITTAPAS